jgi:hypothetical protein
MRYTVNLPILTSILTPFLTSTHPTSMPYLPHGHGARARALCDKDSLHDELFQGEWLQSPADSQISRPSCSWLVCLATIWTQSLSYLMLGQPSTALAGCHPGTTASWMASCLGKSLAFFGQSRTTWDTTPGVYNIPCDCGQVYTG